MGGGEILCKKPYWCFKARFCENKVSVDISALLVLSVVFLHHYTSLTCGAVTMCTYTIILCYTLHALRVCMYRIVQYSATCDAVNFVQIYFAYWSRYQTYIGNVYLVCTWLQFWGNCSLLEYFHFVLPLLQFRGRYFTFMEFLLQHNLLIFYLHFLADVDYLKSII